MKLLEKSALKVLLDQLPNRMLGLVDIAALFSTSTVKAKEVRSADIFKVLKNMAPEALTNAEIRDALGYSKHDTTLISARASNLTKRKMNKVVETTKDGLRAWRAE